MSMLKPALVLTLFIFVSSLSSFAQDHLKEVKGTVFIGKEEATYQEGCEGCGNRGEISFFNDGTAEILWAGSDIIESGPYKQKNGKVIFYGKLEFSVSKDGKSIFHKDYGSYIFDRLLEPD